MIFRKIEGFKLTFDSYLHYIETFVDLKKMIFCTNADHHKIIQLQIGLEITLFFGNIAHEKI